jgi:integrase
MARQKKRGIRGAGSVFQRKDGRWEAKFKVEETGKYKSLYASTEKEAYKKLQDALFEQRQGILATGPDQSVKDFLEYWLEDIKKQDLWLGTYLNYRVLVYKHLIPGIGHIRLRKLTTHQLQLFFAKKVKEGTSLRLAQEIHMVFRQALEHARRMKLVGQNVANDVELATPDRYRGPVLDEKGAGLLMEKARERGLEAAIALAVITGMRVGEILGLHWSDIDLDKGRLHIYRTLHYIPKYGFIEGDPKSESSERDIVLPQVVIGLLKQHRTTQLEKRLQAGSAWVDRDVVFCNEKNGNFIVYITFLRHFYEVLAAAGLPHMHFHDLRHSAATILLSVGVHPHVVQELLGHSDVSITLRIYGHVLPRMRQDVANKMDDLYGGQA